MGPDALPELRVDRLQGDRGRARGQAGDGRTCDEAVPQKKVTIGRRVFVYRSGVAEVVRTSEVRDAA